MTKEKAIERLKTLSKPAQQAILLAAKESLQERKQNEFNPKRMSLRRKKKD